MSYIEPVKSINEFKFYIYGNKHALNNSVFNHNGAGIESPDIYDNKSPKENGLIDLKMGTTNNNLMCSTCNFNSLYCPGHTGHIRLEAPMFHIEFFPIIKDILNCVCHRCSKLRGNEQQIRELKKKQEGMSNEKKYEIAKSFCSKINLCSRCNAPLYKFTTYINKSELIMEFVAEKKIGNTKNKLELDQLSTHKILKNISDEDARLLGFNIEINRPEDLMYKIFSVPPVAIRPSIRMEDSTRDDDLTKQLSSIFKYNFELNKSIHNDKNDIINTKFNIQLLQSALASYIDNSSQYAPVNEIKKQPTKSLVDRIKGKEGRIQGNLMAKRVNYCGRSVLTGDASISVSEVGVPIHIAKTLTVAEYTTPYNINKLREYIKNGKNNYPGANYIKPKRFNYNKTIDLEFIKNNIELELGDIVERHLIDGDIVLFNRQPSLHKYSMMAHKVKVINNPAYASLRLNEGVTDPYNADYDGDEMNIFIPRTTLSRIELEQLIKVQNLLIKASNSRTVVGCKLDGITGPYLLSITDYKFNRCQVMNLLSYILPPIDKIKEYENITNKLYTGKEVISFIIPKKINISDNIKIVNGELLEGSLTKEWLGGGSNKSLIRLILDLYDDEEARKFFDNIEKLGNKYLELRGFTSSLDDIIYNDDLTNKTQEMIKTTLLKVNVELSEAENDPTMTKPEITETLIMNMMGNLRDNIGALIIKNFRKGNALHVYMESKSSSKIDPTAICKACALYGQGTQSNTKSRFVKKDMRRTLPYFNRDIDGPDERGFTKTGFLQGMEYPNFIFDAIVSREALIIVQTKTAESGYFEKKITKLLEDIKVCNDLTVRNAANNIVQFNYSDNGLSSVKQYSYKIRYLGKNYDEIKEFYYVKNDKMMDKYYNKIIKYRKILLENQIKIYTKIIDINAYYKFMIGINYEKIRSMMNKKNNAKSDIDIEYILNKIKDFNKKYNVILNGTKDKLLKEKYESNKLCKLSTIASLYDIFNPKEIIEKYKVDKDTLDEIFDEIINDSLYNLIEPGESVGILAGGSICENITQTNLRAHHKVGIVSKTAANAGFSRLSELISMTKKGKAPSMSIKFKPEYSNDIKYVKNIKSIINQTKLIEIRNEINVYYDPNKQFEKEDNIVNTFNKVNSKCNWLVRIKLNKDLLYMRNIKLLDILAQFINVFDNKLNIKENKENKRIYNIINECECKCSEDYIDIPIIHIRFSMSDYNMNIIQLFIDNIIDTIKINGIENILDSSINSEMEEDNKNYRYEFDGKDIKQIQEEIITTDGINIDDIRLIKGVDAERTLINDMNLIYKLYGIEALRYALIDEFTRLTQNEINYNHIAVLIDFMTYKGYPISIDRNGITKSDATLCNIISFEEPVNTLVNASLFEKSDNIKGISGRVMTGQNINAGTGFNKVIMNDEMIINAENDLVINEEEEENNAIDDIIENDFDNEFDFMPDDD